MRDITKRMGWFRVSREMIDQCSDKVLMIMARVIVVRCEHHLMRDYLQYDAYSPDFRALEEGEMIPEYLFVFHKQPGGKVTMRAEEVR